MIFMNFEVTFKEYFVCKRPFGDAYAERLLWSRNVLGWHGFARKRHLSFI